MQKVISRSEYLQLVGLLALAQKHNKILEDITESAQAITGNNDITEDAVFCDYGADELLERLDIRVVAVVGGV